MRKNINNELIKFASESTTNIQKKITLGKINDLLVESILEREINISVKNYQHTISNFEVKHALTKHSRDPLPLNKRDIGLIPDIIKNYDSIKYAGKTKIGLDAIKYTKQYKNVIYYIEEIRTGKKELAFKTMYKNKKPGTKGAL